MQLVVVQRKTTIHRGIKRAPLEICSAKKQRRKDTNQQLLEQKICYYWAHNISEAADDAGRQQQKQFISVYN
jgi:hypothetical protein